MEPLYFRENNSKGADAIVFIHGGGIGGRLWKEALRELSEYHCLAPDLPGHGQSTHIKPFTLERAVEGLAELIRERVPLRRASVVALSVGVSISLGLLDRYPELVQKLFLSGPTPRFGPVATGLMNFFSRPFLALMGPEQRAGMVARSFKLTDEQIADFRADLDRLTPDLFLQVNDVVAGQGDPGPDSPSMVVFAGEKELGAVKRRARELVRASGKGKGYVVRGLGHGWCLEDPELFHQTVRAWMSSREFGDRFAPLLI